MGFGSLKLILTC